MMDALHVVYSLELDVGKEKGNIVYVYLSFILCIFVNARIIFVVFGEVDFHLYLM